MAAGESGPSDFKVMEETIEGDTAEVKFTTSYEEKPETFKLIKVNGEWKVSEEQVDTRKDFKFKKATFAFYTCYSEQD